MNKILYTSVAVAMLAAASYAQEEAAEAASADVEFKLVEKCVDFKNGTGDYDKTCIKSGLFNMEEGKCYTLNKDRGPSPMWINDHASETWWWSETDCFDTVAVEKPASSSSEESSSSIESSSSEEVVPAKEIKLVEKCIAYKHGVGGYTENCYNSGLNAMEEGACYAFNPAKREAFKNEIYVNGTASDTAWWVKADCFDTVAVEKPASSSSEESSSSVESSSSETVPAKEFTLTEKCIAYKHGVGGYTENCYNSGLTAMEDGACYAFNPAKREAFKNEIYVNGTASDTAWWVKTDCFDTNYVENSSSSEPSSSDDSSSSEESSSSVESSSSEEVVESSSSEEVVDSSSSEESSSSVESSSSEESSSSVESSSSEEVQYKLVDKCGEFENGRGNYASSCFKTGLLNMAEGKCYTMNSARGEAPTWINNDASQDWWWVETDCFDSVVVDPNAPVEPAKEFKLVEKCIEYVHGAGEYAKNCYKSGLNGMKENTCYALKSTIAKENQFTKYINGNAFDKAWWVETDCFDTVYVDDEEGEEEGNTEVGGEGEGEGNTEVGGEGEEEGNTEVGGEGEEEGNTEGEGEGESEGEEEVVEPANRCIAFVNGVDNYGSECFNEGLLNIAEGKCYTMNPDRAGQYFMYINNDASDSWWWKEVSCFAEEEAPKAAPKPVAPNAVEVVMSLNKRALRVASNSDAVKTLNVFDMNGKLLHSESFAGMAKDVNLAQFAGKGALIVRVSEGSKLVAMKRVSVR